MRTREIVGLVLSALTLPVLVAGLIDPVEGGLAMLVGAVLALATWLVSRVPVPRLEWIGWLVAMAAGSGALVAVVVRGATEGMTPGGAGLPWWVWALVAVYEAAVAVTIAGGVQYVVRHVRRLRGTHGTTRPGTSRYPTATTAATGVADRDRTSTA